MGVFEELLSQQACNGAGPAVTDGSSIDLDDPMTSAAVPVRKNSSKRTDRIS